MSKARKVFWAALWSAGDVLLRQGVQFVTSVVLARLLSPEEFGIIALLSLFTGIAGTFVESGLSMALIQRQDVTREDESSVFWFNLGVGCLMALLLWLCAPAIAALYTTPILIPLTGVMAVNIVIAALGSIQNTFFTKQLNFRPLMLVSVLSALASGSVAVALAYKGFGFWALVAQTLIANFTATSLLWLLSPWRPAVVFNLASLRRLFGFGGYMLASTLLDISYNRLYTVLIGKFYGPKELGFYSRAESVAQLPGWVTSGIIARVTFPLLSVVAGNKTLLRDNLRFAVQGTMLLNVPVMLGLAVVSEPLLLTLFGEKWLPALPLIQILCISGLLLPLHVLNVQTLMVLGHSDLYFRLEVAKKLFGVLIMVLASAYGPMGITVGVATSSFVALFINTHYTRRFLDYGAFRQLSDVMPILGVAMAMACGLLLIQRSLNNWRPVTQLFTEVTLGTIGFTGLASVLRLPAYTAACAAMKLVARA
jgi:teichuronic acid exporter